MKGLVVLLRNPARLLVERLGTMAAAYLIARGVESDTVVTAVNAVTALALVAVEWVVVTMTREKELGQAYMAGRFPDQQDRYSSTPFNREGD